MIAVYRYAWHNTAAVPRAVGVLNGVAGVTHPGATETVSSGRPGAMRICLRFKQVFRVSVCVERFWPLHGGMAPLRSCWARHHQDACDPP